jgi:uncharacterized protein (UPF0335 family)
MARKLKDDAAKSNLSPDTFLEYVRELGAARTEKESASGKYRSVLKRAKSAGINTAMMLRALEEKRQDDQPREMNDLDLARYRAWLGVPIGTQAALDFEEPSDEARAKQTEHEAGEAGLAAGKAGHPREGNPHTTASPNWAAWDRAWVAGQETLIDKLSRGEAPEPKTNGATRGRRGRGAESGEGTGASA